MKGNLLIVDDEVDLSENMAELLEDEADDIFTASNGLEAMQILLSHKIDCVVSDIKMPVMDGLQLIQKAHESGLDMPFIFYTGHGSKELKNQAESLGAVDLLTKPNFLNLELAVRKALAHV